MCQALPGVLPFITIPYSKLWRRGEGTGLGETRQMMCLGENTGGAG
jgi:hypothetical protein